MSYTHFFRRVQKKNDWILVSKNPAYKLIEKS